MFETLFAVVAFVVVIVWVMRQMRAAQRNADLHLSEDELYQRWVNAAYDEPSAQPMRPEPTPSLTASAAT